MLLDDSFASIAAAVELGRAVYANIRRFLVYPFSHNLAGLAPILAATFVRFPLVPVSALPVLSRAGYPAALCHRIQPRGMKPEHLAGLRSLRSGHS